MKYIKAMFGTALLSLAMFFPASAQQKPEEKPDEPKPKTPVVIFSGMARFITDAVISDNTLYEYDMPNLILTAKIPKHKITISGALKLDNAQPSRFGRKTDIRLFFLKAAKEFNKGFKLEGGLFAPSDLLGNSNKQMEQGFPLPALDRVQNILRGGLTGFTLQKTQNLTKKTDLIVKGGRYGK
ncbi:MAG: hypothetical protein ACT4OY_08160 [Alphaproteobacteria bacterium]